MRFVGEGGAPFRSASPRRARRSHKITCLQRQAHASIRTQQHAPYLGQPIEFHFITRTKRLLDARRPIFKKRRERVPPPRDRRERETRAGAPRGASNPAMALDPVEIARMMRDRLKCPLWCVFLSCAKRRPTERASERASARPPPPPSRSVEENPKHTGPQTTPPTPNEKIPQRQPLPRPAHLCRRLRLHLLPPLRRVAARGPRRREGRVPAVRAARVEERPAAQRQVPVAGGGGAGGASGAGDRGGGGGAG